MSVIVYMVKCISPGSEGSVQLTVLSRVAMSNSRLRSISMVIHSLNFNFIWNKRGSSRHNKLGVVGHGHCGPLTVHSLLPPHYSIMKPRAVRLEVWQWLQRRKLNKLKLNLFLTSLWKMNDCTLYNIWFWWLIIITTKKKRPGNKLNCIFTSLYKDT